MQVLDIDLEAVLRRSLTEDELGALPHLVDQAQLLIEGYTGGDYSEDEVPVAVKTVAVRMIARSLNADPALEGVASRSETNGPFNRSVTFVAGSTGLFINKADRQMLVKLRNGYGFGAIRLGNY